MENAAADAVSVRSFYHAHAATCGGIKDVVVCVNSPMLLHLIVVGSKAVVAFPLPRGEIKGLPLPTKLVPALRGRELNPFRTTNFPPPL